MERIRDMGLGFLVYLFVLGALYVVSDKKAPEVVQAFASEKNDSHKNEQLKTAYDSTMTLKSAERNSGVPAWQAGGQNEAVFPAGGGMPEVSSFYIQSGKAAFQSTGFLESFLSIEKGAERPF